MPIHTRTPETSAHTSIKARVDGKDQHLLPLTSDCDHDTQKSSIPISHKDYLILVDWTGRALRPNKRGAIANDQPPILTRLGLAPEDWIQEMNHYGKWYYRAAGSVQALRRYCEYLEQQWLKGTGSSSKKVIVCRS